MTRDRKEVVRCLSQALDHSLGGKRLAGYNLRWGTAYGSVTELAFDLLDPTLALSQSPETRQFMTAPEVVDAMRLALFWLSR